MLWTDPPYGVEYVGKTTAALTMQGDNPDALRELLDGVFANLTEHLQAGSPFYVAAPSGPLWALIYEAVVATGWRFHQGLVWVKDSMVLGHSDYHFRHENVLYGWLPGEGRSGRGQHEGTRWHGDHAQTSVMEVPRPKRSTEHPTAKPVALVEGHLHNSSRAGSVVLDTFLGSGTTLIAAERLGRRCYGMEIDPRYVDVTVRRYQDYTGRQAVLERTGREEMARA